MTQFWPISPKFGQPNLSFKNMGPSVVRYHHIQNQKKTNHPILRKLSDGQTDGQTARQTDRQTDKQTGRQIDSQTDRQTDRQTKREISEDAVQLTSKRPIYNSTKFRHIKKFK